MTRYILKMPPYYVDVNGHRFCLCSSKSIACKVTGPTNGVIEVAVEDFCDLGWYEADIFDEEQFDNFLKGSISQLMLEYAFEDDSKLSTKALEVKKRLLDMFYEGVYCT